MEYPPTWTCQVTLLRLDRYLLGTLFRSELLAIAEHLEACMSCAQTLALRLAPRDGRGRGA
jgi:anti-sigma factor RsiW